MAWHLFRLGRWSFVHRKIVASAWLGILVAMIIGAGTLSGKTNDSFELDGIESTDAFALIKERSGQGLDGASARIVFGAPEGSKLTDPENQAVINDALAALDEAETQSVSLPAVEAGSMSENGKVGYSSVTFAKTIIELETADREALEDVREIAEAGGLEVAIGGEAAMEEMAVPIGELVGIAVGFIVLAVTLGSLIAAGMPLLTALIGVGVGMLAITAATGFIEMGSTTTALGVMLGLAVGIDYALFIMARYQDELRHGRSREEAIGRAVGTAGSAVVFAGLTVIIALVGLVVVGIPFLTEMGFGAGFMVAIAVLVALTLLPAFLGFAGERVKPAGQSLFSKKVKDPNTVTRGRKWIEAVVKRKWLALAGGVAIAGVLSIPVASMNLAIPDDGVASKESDARVAFDLISENFGAGSNGPLVIVIDTAKTGSVDEAMVAVQTATDELMAYASEGNSGIAAVVPALMSDAPEAVEAFKGQLEAVNFATLTVIPTTGPSAEETKELVTDVRTVLADLPAETGGIALVSGSTAVGVDIADEVAGVFPVYLLVVVGLAVFLLIAVFRSVWVPVKAALGFMLSVGVSLGVTTAVFQWGWLNQLIGLDATGPVMFILPILLTGILFGLAMDYEVFLVTRMRECYVHGMTAKDAIVEGFVYSARVVVAAAIIMIGVFGGFALIDNVIMKSVGFALAVGVLADAFLVRMLIVPAIMAIAGDKIWWMPGWMKPIVPTFDVEGEGLAKHLDAPKAEAAGATS